MAKFIMLIGLPGCGKSSYAKSQIYNHEPGDFYISGSFDVSGNDPVIIVSSDYLREKMGFDPGTGTTEVFAKMHELTEDALSKGISVIYDATNLGRKRRIGTLQMVQKYTKDTTAVLFTEPVEVVKQRNKQRDSKWVVPDDVIDNMLRQFQVPLYMEGILTVEKVQTAVGHPLDFYLEKAKGFEQDNSHHALTLYAHLKKAYDFIPEDAYPVKQAALYHDIGKLYTKDFHNAKGEPTTEAHYYGHENVGAYLYLSADKGAVLFRKEYYIAILINWHMRKYLNLSYRKQMNENRLIGSEMQAELDLLHQADLEAH